MQIVLLLGGATARIGDPSGKSSEREMLGDEVIDNNIRGIRENLERVVRNHGELFWGEGRGVLDQEFWETLRGGPRAARGSLHQG